MCNICRVNLHDGINFLVHVKTSSSLSIKQCFIVVQTKYRYMLCIYTVENEVLQTKGKCYNV